ncbi:MAG TPA: peptidoglycan DD-metalloendopeptidase family protein [Candidatus Dojkabacteria bacterium]|jgi:murein DD-endopeptidase MepM/ murein hydrolase activator NlpD
MENTAKNINDLAYAKREIGGSAKKRNILTGFIVDLVSYVLTRTRQIIFFSWAGFLSTTSIFEALKSWSIRRMYWGRSSLYRTAFHIVIFSITLVSLFVGISSRINVFTSERDQSGLVLSSGAIGNSDTLYQAGTTETIVASNPAAKNWPEYTHKVVDGETLESIANVYGVSTGTIRWANNLSSDRVRIDQILTVPGLDGVLYTVKSGDTVDSIIKSSTIKNANTFDIIELNELQPPNYTLSEGQELFIPNAIVVPVASRNTSNRSGGGGGSFITLSDPGISVPSGTFINPLTFCPGYSISRGVLPWHNGVDMAKNGGCWVNSTAGGVVEVAGWGSYGQGFYVKINHQNGFVSYYYHGNGEFAVKKGDSINAGQRILHMGCTGNCTGTHVHFEMHYNGGVVNPANYMKL